LECQEAEGEEAADAKAAAEAKSEMEVSDRNTVT
jgi:hypothetical protein